MSKAKEFWGRVSCVLTGKPPETNDSEDILADIDEIVIMLSHCRRVFNLVTDNDLIEAAIYEELALRSRYAYLMKRARAEGITGKAVLK